MTPLPQTLRQADSFDDRAREVLENVLANDSLQGQIRDCFARTQRGEQPEPWDVMVAEARAGRTG
jgi:hypothetical protein